jgi:hypothetical protein
MFGTAMNRSQRVVLIVYCLLLTYCCVWIPWCENYHVTSPYARHTYYRIGYGWLWAGPRVLVEEVDPEASVDTRADRKDPSGLTILGEVTLRKVPTTGFTYAEPDSRLIALRLGAATAIAAAAFLFAGVLWKSLPS